MSEDNIYIILGWLITIVLLLLYVPRNKIREAHVIFLSMQLVTCILGLTVSELKLVEYPVRSFSYATRTSFDFEYFIYPSLCVLFNLHFPEKKSPFRKLMYYFKYCTLLTVIEVIVEKHTNILKYINWAWYISWISLFSTFYISRIYYIWFFRLKEN